MLRCFAIGVITAVTALQAAPVWAEEGACFADWSVAAPIVRQEGLMSVEQLTAAAHLKLKGDIVKATLCVAKGAAGGRYEYRLVVRAADGRLTPLTVDAKHPFGD